MATYEVKAPNGRTYIVEGPSGASEDVVRAQVLSRYPESGKAAAPTRPVQKPAPKATQKPSPKLDTSQAGVAARGAGRAVAPTLGGWAGAATGAGLGALTGPLAPIASPLLAIAGGLGGGIGINALQEKVLKDNPRLAAALGQSEAQRSSDVKSHPMTAFASEFVPGFLTGRPSLSSASKAATTAQKVVGGLTGNAAAGAFGAGFETLREGLTGETLDPRKVAVAAAATAAQRKGWGPQSFSSARLTPLQEALLKSKGPANAEARTTVETLRAAGVKPVPHDIADDVVRSTVIKASGKTPTARDLAVKYAQGAQSETPEVSQKIVNELAPSDTRTVEKAAAEAASDIAEHPDVIAAKPQVTRGEAGSNVHKRLNAERDAAWSGVNEAYDAARETGDAFVDPEFGKVIRKTIKDALTPAIRRYKTEIPSTLNINTYANRLLSSKTIKVKDLFDVRSDLTAIMGDKAGSPDAAAARDMRSALDSVIDQIDEGGGIAGDENTVKAWRDAISARRKFGKDFEGNDIIETLTERTRKGGAQTSVVDPADVENLLFGKGSVSGARGQVDNLRRLRDRLGETSPEWEAVRTAASERLFGKDFGTKTFGSALNKFQSENPALADILLTPEDRVRLGKAQDVITGATGRQAAQKSGVAVMDANPLDFADSISRMNSAEIRDARVAARQVLRNAMNRPRQSATMLEQISTGVDTKKNVIALFGPDEGGKLIQSAKALADRFERAGEIRPAPPEAEGSAEAKIPAAIASGLLGAKAFPAVTAIGYLKSLGFGAKKAERLVSEAFNPDKTDEALAMIERMYGKSAVQKFLATVPDRFARQEPVMRNVSRVSGTLSGNVAPTVPETPEDNADQEVDQEAEGAMTPDYQVPYIAKIIKGHEGTGQNPESSAFGNFQFTKGTLAAMYNKEHPDAKITDDEADAMRRDGRISPEDLDRYGIAFTEENVQRVLDAGEPVTVGNVYLMHFAGEGGGPAILNADPSTPLKDVLSGEAIERNRKIEFNGKRFPEFTVQDVRDWAESAMYDSYEDLRKRGEIE